MSFNKRCGESFRQGELEVSTPHAVTNQSGLGPNMLAHIMALYSHHSATIQVNGSLSPVFNVRNGTRQGCLLSSVLYVLTMEHLAVALRQNPNIVGLHIGNHY